MNPKVSFTLVGLFVIALGITLSAGVVWLSASSADKGYNTYVTYLNESVGGLSLNASVSYNGVEVGRVRLIELDHDNPQQVRVLMEIEEDVPIMEDTTAMIASQGITGVSHIELSGGTADSQPLQAREGERYPEIQTTPSLFVRLDQTISGLVVELTGAAASLTGVAERIEAILSEDNQAAISGTLTNVEELTASMEDIFVDVAIVVGNVATASNELPNIFAEVTDTIAAYEDTADSFTSAGDAVAETAESIADAVDDITESLTTILADLTPFSRGVPANLVSLVDELSQLGASLRRVVQDVERNPNMLLFGRPEGSPGPGED